MPLAKLAALYIPRPDWLRFMGRAFHSLPLLPPYGDLYHVLLRFMIFLTYIANPPTYTPTPNLASNTFHSVFLSIPGLLLKPLPFLVIRGSAWDQSLQIKRIGGIHCTDSGKSPPLCSDQKLLSFLPCQFLGRHQLPTPRPGGHCWKLQPHDPRVSFH